jgi:hypothetical protein
MISTPYEMHGTDTGGNGSDEAKAARDEARVRRDFWPSCGAMRRGCRSPKTSSPPITVRSTAGLPAASR